LDRLSRTSQVPFAQAVRVLPDVVVVGDDEGCGLDGGVGEGDGLLAVPHPATTIGAARNSAINVLV
jgi:hypothetical protein